MRNLFVSLMLAVFFVGCTQQVCLKKSPSEIVLTSIKSENGKKVAYSFKSNIPEPLILRNFSFDVNSAYLSNLKIYMNTKYSVVESDSINIDFTLISCNQTIKSTNSGLQNTVNVLASIGGNTQNIIENILLTTDINLKVIVKNGNDIISEKSIYSTDEYNGTKNDVTVAQNSFDQAIGKSIIMVDKFLSGINLKAQ